MYILSVALCRLDDPAIRTPSPPDSAATLHSGRTVNEKLSASPSWYLASGLCVRLAGKRAEVSPPCSSPKRHLLVLLGAKIDTR
jgi:hypothetical protein